MSTHNLCRTFKVRLYSILLYSIIVICTEDEVESYFESSAKNCVYSLCETSRSYSYYLHLCRKFLIDLSNFDQNLKCLSRLLVGFWCHNRGWFSSAWNCYAIAAKTCSSYTIIRLCSYLFVGKFKLSYFDSYT